MAKLMKQKPAAKTIRNTSNPDKYERDYSWNAKQIKEAKDIRTTTEMMAFLESPEGKGVEVEARVLAHKPGEGFGVRKLNRSGFIESFRANNDGRKKFREAINDSFSGGGIGAGYGNNVGQDFTPLLGGPFYKNQYYYNDFLLMHQECFTAYTKDPYGKATVNIINDFTLGRGFSIEFESDVMQALWEAFEKANDFQDMFRTFASELSAYGENMLWKLPNMQRYMIYPQNKINLDDVPKVIIPRIRSVDPSNFVEIITYPEDITRVLFYVWLTPTQYQIYSAKDPSNGQVVNSTKLIYQQIPADQILHYKINAVSNEKRGRSDLFAALPYFKRLRDSVNYEIIAQQKNAAWAIDTEINGDQQDLDAYISAQQALGTIVNAGSEFVHTAAVKRQYLGNQGSAKGVSTAFEWCLSMVAASTGIPISYYGTHLSGGSTRASAIVGTEPVAKRFEMRQQVLKRAISDVADWLMDHFGIRCSYNVTFPEIITQDRTQKLKDIYMGEQAGWFSPERAAETAASEMGFTDYSYEQERITIKEQQADEPSLMLGGVSPLTPQPAPPQEKPGAAHPLASGPAPIGTSGALTGNEKGQVKANDRQ